MMSASDLPHGPVGLDGLPELSIRPFCPDCKTPVGQLHQALCDVEQCPDCGGQMKSCRCNSRVIHRPLPWAGHFPRAVECQEFGWYARLVAGRGYVPCEPTEPGAVADENRLLGNAVWDADAGRFVKPNYVAHLQVSGE